MILDTTVLPCGCILRKELIEDEKVVVYIPCRPTCKYYMYFVQSTEEKSIPLFYKEI